MEDNEIKVGDWVEITSICYYSTDKPGFNKGTPAIVSKIYNDEQITLMIPVHIYGSFDNNKHDIGVSITVSKECVKKITTKYEYYVIGRMQDGKLFKNKCIATNLLHVFKIFDEKEYSISTIISIKDAHRFSEYGIISIEPM